MHSYVSDPNLRRSTVMNGNRVKTFISNWGTVGTRGGALSGVWPRGSSHDHIFEFKGDTIVIISDGYTHDGGTLKEFDPVTNVEYK